MIFFSQPTNVTKVERLYRAARLEIAGYFSSTLIPLAFSDACLPPLHFTLTHVALPFYKRAFCSQSSFQFRIRPGLL